MALFKARGKYDDLASGDQPKLAQKSTSETKADFAATMPVLKPVSEAASSGTGKKDMHSVLRSRNAAAVSNFIEKQGLGVCFKAGADGVSPIELAFSSNNAECGRVMLKAIEDALLSGKYVFEKPEAAEEKNEAANDLTKRYTEAVAAAPAPEPKVASQSLPDSSNRKVSYSSDGGLVARRMAAIQSGGEKNEAAPAVNRQSSTDGASRKISSEVARRMAALEQGSQASSKKEASQAKVPRPVEENKAEIQSLAATAPAVSSWSNLNIDVDPTPYVKSFAEKNWIESPLNSPEGNKAWVEHTTPKAVEVKVSS